MEIIRSKDNPKVRRLALLHDRRKAMKDKVVFIEGIRLCEDALESGIKPIQIAFTPARESMVMSYVKRYCLSSELIMVTEECFDKIASTLNPQGVAMIVNMPSLERDIPYRGDGTDIYVALESLQDPGNLGTIIRLADAFDFSAVLLTSGTVDPFNEKVLRASMGSTWHVPIIRVDSVDSILDFCKQKSIATLAMELNGDRLDKSNLSLPCCYLIGNEGNGLTDYSINKCDKRIKIPMPGKAESLNASTAASIIGYVLSSMRE